MKNIFTIDAMVSVHNAGSNDEKYLYILKDLYSNKINNKEIGAIIPGTEEVLGSRSSIALDSETAERIFDIKQTIYSKMKDTKRSLTSIIANTVQQKYPTMDLSSWDKLVGEMKRNKMKISSHSLKVKIVMQHIVPEQSDYGDYNMSRYNHRPGYYSSNQQVAEFNVPILHKVHIAQISKMIHDMLSDILGVPFIEGTTRESISSLIGRKNIDPMRELLKQKAESAVESEFNILTESSEFDETDDYSEDDDGDISTSEEYTHTDF